MSIPLAPASRRFLRAALVVLACGLAAACSDDDGPTRSGENPPPEGQMPDFAALDVNTTSPRAGQQVSPRDYLEKVSAWYFGHAT